MKRQGLLLVAIVLSSTAAEAQEGAEPLAERAHELREKLTCPTDVTWPRLPDAGRRVFGDVQFAGAHQLAVITERGETPADPTVRVPQYAYFLHPDLEVCYPVVILQSSELALGYELVGTGQVGAAWRAFFILLGMEAPRQRGRNGA